MKGLQEVLDDLRGPGTWDSKGSFTLDVSRGREKLARYRLPQPHYYVLNLVALGCLSGSKEIEVRIDSDEVEFHFEVDPLEGIELADLEAHALRRGQPALFELAVAVQAARRLKLWRLLVRSGGQLHNLNSDDPPQQSGPGFGFALWEKPGVRTARKFMTGHREKEALLRARCEWCPLPLRLNDRLVNREPDCQDWTAVAKLKSPAVELGGGPRVDLEVESEGGYAGYVALVFNGHGQDLKLVLSGVTFPWPRKIDVPGLRGMIYSDVLRKDLSQQNILQDAVYEQLHRQVEQLVERLWSRLPWPPGAPSHFESRTSEELAPLLPGEERSRPGIRWCGPLQDSNERWVLLPSPCHTARIYYQPEFDLASALGVSTLALSHPLCHPLFWGVYPEFHPEEWGRWVAREVESVGWSRCRVLLWNTPLQIVEILHRAFVKLGLKLDGVSLLHAPPFLPDKLEFTGQGLVDSDSLAKSWPQPSQVTGYCAPELVEEVMSKVSDWPFPFESFQAPSVQERIECKMSALVAQAQGLRLGRGRGCVTIEEGYYPFVGAGTQTLAEQLLGGGKREGAEGPRP